MTNDEKVAIFQTLKFRVNHVCKLAYFGHYSNWLHLFLRDKKTTFVIKNYALLGFYRHFFPNSGSLLTKMFRTIKNKSTSLESENQAGPFMAPGGIRCPSIGLGWSHGSIASWPPIGAIGDHQRPCIAQASFQCLVLYL